MRVRLADVFPVFLLEDEREREEAGEEKEHQDSPVPAARLRGFRHVGEVVHEIGDMQVSSKLVLDRPGRMSRLEYDQFEDTCMSPVCGFIFSSTRSAWLPWYSQSTCGIATFGNTVLFQPDLLVGSR